MLGVCRTDSSARIRREAGEGIKAAGTRRELVLRVRLHMEGNL